MKQFFLFLLFFRTFFFAAAQKPTPLKENLSAIDHYNLGKVLVAQKKINEAIAEFKKAVTADTTLSEAWFELGWCYNETGNYKDAVPPLMEAKKTLVSAPKVYYELGFAFQQNKQPDYALLYYKKCISIKKDFTLAYLKMGDISFEQNNFKEALMHYTQYKNFTADSLITDELYFKIGFCKNETNDYTGAIEELKLALSKNPALMAAKNEIAIAYARLKNTNEAEKWYQTVLKEDAKNFDAVTGLGDMNKNIIRNSAAAIPYYLIALEQKPNDKFILYKLGWCFNDIKEHTKALDYLLKAVEKDKQFEEALAELGFAYYSLNRNENALNTYKKISNLSQKPLPLYYSGLCYIKLNKINEAQRVYNELQPINPGYAQLLLKKINEKK